MQQQARVYAGVYINALRLDNIPRAHITATEQELVDLLLADIGDTMAGVSASSLEELSLLLADYADDPYSCISYTVA